MQENKLQRTLAKVFGKELTLQVQMFQEIVIDTCKSFNIEPSL